MARVMLSIGLILSLIGLDAQVTLSGTISSAEDDTALVGVGIGYGEGRGTSSDLDGRYSLELSPGVYQLSFRAVGYKDLSREIRLDADLTLDIALEAKTELLNQVVISAGRYEQNVAEVTVSMEVLRPELISNRTITALDDALRESPGMIIVDGEPQIRSGSGYSFGAGSRVQVLLDGIPQLSGDVGRPSWSNMPMEVVDQVEVIKGASSVLYGSAALSGVVHVRSMLPSLEPSTQIQAYAGAYAKPRSVENHYWSGNNIISGRIVRHAQRFGNLDFVLGLDLLSDDGHLGPTLDSLGVLIASPSTTDAHHHAAERRARGWMKLSYNDQKIPGLKYGLSLNGQKNANVSTLLWDNTDTGLYSSFAGSATETQQTISNFNPFVDYRSPQGHQVSYKANWFSLDNANSNDQDNFSDVWFNELQVQINGDAIGLQGLKLTSGGAYTQSDSESQLFNNLGASSSHDSENFAVYTQADMAVSERLNASAGLRWESFTVDGEEEDRPVFRAGLNYHLGQATYLRASYGQGYRFPTIGERFISTAVGVLNIYPNPELKSETSENFELGVKQGFAVGAFSGYADLAYFHQTFENYIEFSFGLWAPEPSPFNLFGLGFTSLNTGSARVDGAELSIAARGEVAPRATLSLLAGYTYTKPVSTTPDLVYAEREFDNDALQPFTQVSYNSSSSDPRNDILKYRMQHLVRLNADLSSRRSTVGFGIRYNSFMQNIDAVFEELDDPGFLGQEDLRPLPTGVRAWRDERNKGDLILDARFGYTIFAEHQLSLIVDNVFNREYTIRPLYLESTRRVMAKLTLNF